MVTVVVVMVVVVFTGNISAVYLLNRIMAMVMSNDLMFLNNSDSLGTSGGGMYLHAEAFPFHLEEYQIWKSGT